MLKNKWSLLIWFVVIALVIGLMADASSEDKTIGYRPMLLILGIAQDGGYPQAGCTKSCCKAVADQAQASKQVAAIAVIDEGDPACAIIDATPDFKQQFNWLQRHYLEHLKINPSIFLTHAHMGHYTGLIHLGREAMGTQGWKVYAMPRMAQFLAANGPWSQLVSLNNIALQPMKNKQAIHLNKQVTITPFLVPHRDEFSETVGYEIKGPSKTAIYIPDIDKWSKWETDITAKIKQVDLAFLDGTFYANGELPGRNMSEIPHPFIEESMALFANLSKEDKAKIHFIHFNHTNPVLQSNSAARKAVLEAGFNIAEEGMQFGL